MPYSVVREEMEAQCIRVQENIRVRSGRLDQDASNTSPDNAFDNVPSSSEGAFSDRTLWPAGLDGEVHSNERPSVMQGLPVIQP